MKSIQELREERKNIAAQMTALVQKPETEKWTNDDQTKYNDLKAAVDNIDAHISAFKETLEMTESQENHVANVAVDMNISVDEATVREQKLKACTNAWLRGGVENLTTDQREFMAKEVKRVSAAMGIGEANNGGALVHREFVSRLLEAMKSFGGMRSIATVMQTATGNPMDMPTTDSTSEEGEIVGESVEVGEEDTEFGTKSMGAFKYSSKSIALPYELTQDSGIDVEAHILRLLAMRIARIQNKHFTIGTGTGQPEGVVTAATVGEVAAAAADITFDELDALAHSVDPIYRESGKCLFMFNDMTLKKLKGKKDANNRPLWLPSLDTGAPDRIGGYGYQINQQMADIAANAKAVAFGDFSHYTIRDVMQLMLFRMTDSKYTLKGQVGFVGFQRSDGKLLDVGGAVKTLQCAAS
jgi:HK97 family phage major capsid protein